MQKSPNISKTVVVGHNKDVHIISEMNKHVDIDKMFQEHYTYLKRIYDDKAFAKAMDSIYSARIFKHVER